MDNSPFRSKNWQAAVYLCRPVSSVQRYNSYITPYTDLREKVGTTSHVIVNERLVCLFRPEFFQRVCP